MCAHLPVRRALRNANARKPRLIVDSPSRLRHFHRPSRPNQPVISHQPDQRWAYTLSTGTFGESQRRGHGRVGRHRAAGVHADVHLAGCGVSDWFRGVAGVASQIHDAAGRAGDGRRVFRRRLWRVQSADAFTFDQRRQHVLGAAVDERKLWVHELLMAVVVAEPRPPSGGMVDADSRLVVLLPVDVADVYGPVRVRHAADCHPTHDRRVPRVDGRHPVAQAYGRSCGVPPIGMDTCRSGSGPSKDIRNT